MCIIEKSLKIAIDAYSGKTDKAGEEYILHPLGIMAKMSSAEEKSVALLHDVIEDSEWTEERLIDAGIPRPVVDAVKLLTKRDDETYDVFITRLKGNDLARKVKLADIEDNINLLRLSNIGQEDFDRVAKYHKAWNELQIGK